ncbi:MAG TPA: ABC transporter permease subunit [Candidatus Dietzia intestinigallinarum]|nr:ABC transporter permease subunit [Candidatus Dietzia intestinigallinarum]
MAPDTGVAGPRRSARIVVGLAGLAGLLGVWAAVAAGLPDLALPGPLRTATAVVELGRSGELVEQLGRTLLRTVLGSAFAVVIGVGAGVMCGLSTIIDEAVRPDRVLFAGIPSVVTVVIAMIWLGPGGPVVVIAVATAMFPQTMLAAREATRGVDRDLLEVGTVFGVPLRWRLRHLVLPATAPPVLAALTATLSNALRLVMMEELLAAPDGSGAGIATPRTYLDTPTVFAWAVVAVAFALTVDVVLFGPVRRRAIGWST